MSELLNISRGLAPLPPSPLQMYKGSHAYSHFLGKGGIFGRLSREEFPYRKPESFLFSISRDMRYFSEASRKIKKRGYDLYTQPNFRAFNSLPRKVGRALIILYGCGRAPEGNGKTRTHISRARRKKWNRGHCNVPNVQEVKWESSLERGWVLCRKARKMSVQKEIISTFGYCRGMPSVPCTL